MSVKSLLNRLKIALKSLVIPSASVVETASSISQSYILNVDLWLLTRAFRGSRCCHFIRHIRDLDSRDAHFKDRTCARKRLERSMNFWGRRESRWRRRRRRHRTNERSIDRFTIVKLTSIVYLEWNESRARKSNVSAVLYSGWRPPTSCTSVLEASHLGFRTYHCSLTIPPNCRSCN